jgi:hypothetical protein
MTSLMSSGCFSVAVRRARTRIRPITSLARRPSRAMGVLLSVHCDTSEERARAKKILERTGADDIASTGEEAVGSAVTRDRSVM